ncbi:MAG: hypothetical protein JWQ55_845 [Rhodopila sp.]|jgi:hypothetical protein|nr:hypothetical protein [Rhodopila sp.]
MTIADSRTNEVIAVSLMISAPALIGFYLFRRIGLRRLGETLLPRIARGRPWISSEGVAELGADQRASCGALRALCPSFAWRLVAGCLGVAEIRIALT